MPECLSSLGEDALQQPTVDRSLANALTQLSSPDMV